MYTTANKQHLYAATPELIKALNLHKSLDLGRPIYLSKTSGPLLGNGIIRANGTHWAHQRKLIAPEFFLHKAKVNFCLYVVVASPCDSFHCVISKAKHAPNQHFDLIQLSLPKSSSFTLL